MTNSTVLLAGIVSVFQPASSVSRATTGGGVVVVVVVDVVVVVEVDAAAAGERNEP